MDLYPECIENPYNSTIKREVTQFKNEERIRIDIFPKEDISLANENMKRPSTFLATRNMKNRNHSEIHVTQNYRMAKMETDNNKC